MASSSFHLAPSQLQVATSSQVPYAQVPLQLPPPPTYKSDLQEFADKSDIADPVYEVVNEGFRHAPKFRSTVTVDGMRFTSELTFMRRKAAEQEAARIALEGLTKKIKEEGHAFVRENAILCKSILDEYASKMKKKKPAFNTLRHEGVAPYFESHLDFNGRTYTGSSAINEMDAEHSAAQAAVLSVLGISRLVIFQIIKSKSKLYDVVKTKSLQPAISSGVSPIIANTADYSIGMEHKAADTSVLIDHKDKEIVDPVGDTNNNEVVMVETPESCPVLSICQQSHIPKQEQVHEATNSLNMSQQPDSAVPIGDVLSSKKRRKNNRKAIKKARIEAEICRLPRASGVPVNQTPTC